MTKYVASIGGGISSTLLMPHVMIHDMGIDRREIDFVTCHLPNEDRDVFRLVDKVQELYGIEVKRIGLNKTPFEIFNDVNFLGNSRIDPCSRILKREVMRDYVRSNYDSDTRVAIGITPDEIDRVMGIKSNWKKNGYSAFFPMFGTPKMTRESQMNFCMKTCGFIPRLYLMGFSHNNCGGACIKAGKAEWARLWYFLPEVFQEWKLNELAFRSRVGDYTILTENVSGIKTNLPLDAFDRRLSGEFGATKYDDILAGFQSIARSPYFQSLDTTPGCSFCDAMA